MFSPTFKNKQKIITILRKIIKKEGITESYLFGSFVGSKKYNDLDIAIVPPKDFSLLDLSRVANTVEQKTGIPVDLITLQSINPRLKKQILRDLVAI